MKNLLASWFRSLTAFDESSVKQEFSIVDPTAAQAGGLNTVVLAVAPSDGNSPTIVSLYFDGSGVKLFEKKYQNDADAQTEMSAMATDLNEAAALSKEGKIEEAKKLAESLFEKYKRHSDPLVNEQPTPTMTQSSQEPSQYKGWRIHKAEDGRWMGEYDVMALYADSIDTLKAKIDNKIHQAMSKPAIKKQAGITMQNLFFDTVDEAMDFQEKMKTLQGPEGEGSGESKPLWEQMGKDEQVAPSNESKVEEDNELAPPSLSFDRIEKDKAKSDKDIGKRIKEQVKTEVESALEQKSASVFGPDQEELVEALRKNGRNWDEIKKIFTKELSYNEDDTTVFLDSIRQKEEGVAPEGLPMAPKPPEDLVSPETHDKLLKEIDDISEPKPMPKPLEDEIARADNAEIRKVAAQLPTHILDELKNEIGTSMYRMNAPHSKWYRFSLEGDKIYRGEYTDVSEGFGPYQYLYNMETGETKENPAYKPSLYASLNKSALNPLQEPPAVGQTPGQPLSSPVQENPTFDSPVPEQQTSAPEPEFLEAPKTGDRVYVMGDYEIGQDGYEGTMVSTYISKGDEYAVVSKDDGDNAEVALHRVVKASQKKVAQIYYEKKADAWQPKTGEPCSCRPGIARDNCPSCEGTGIKIDFKKIREKKAANEDRWTKLVYECPSCETQFTESKKPMSACPVCRAPADKIKLIKDASQKNADARSPSAIADEKMRQKMKQISDSIGRRVTPEEANAIFEEEYKKATDAPEKEADLEVEGKANEDVIRMFIENSFPKDKMPVWGTNNLKITKYPNGWALVNYQTPILYRANGSDIVVFNTHKYSVTTSRIQNQMRSMFAGQPVKETDEAGIHAAIDQSNLATPKPEPEPETNPELQSIHESILKLKAELEKEALEVSPRNSLPLVELQINYTDDEAEKMDDVIAVMEKARSAAALDDLPFDIENIYKAHGNELWLDIYANSVEEAIDKINSFFQSAFSKTKQISSLTGISFRKQAADPVPAPEVPTQFKHLERAPARTEREKAQPATEDQAKLVKEVESGLSSLEALKAMINQAKAKLNEEIKNIEQQGGRVQIEAELKQKIDQLSKLVEATQNKMVYAGDTMVRLIQETKEKPFKPSDAWKVEKLTERLSKYEDATKYLEKAVEGAQSLATTESVRDLVFFPRKVSKLHKSAGFIETLDSVYNDVLEALKLLLGNEQEKQPTAV